MLILRHLVFSVLRFPVGFALGWGGHLILGKSAPEDEAVLVVAYFVFIVSLYIRADDRAAGLQREVDRLTTERTVLDARLAAQRGGAHAIGVVTEYFLREASREWWLEWQVVHGGYRFEVVAWDEEAQLHRRAGYEFAPERAQTEDLVMRLRHCIAEISGKDVHSV